MSFFRKIIEYFNELSNRKSERRKRIREVHALLQAVREGRVTDL